MTNALTTFNFNTLTVRVIDREGQPWFAGPDVVHYIGRTVTNTTYDPRDA